MGIRRNVSSDIGDKIRMFYREHQEVRREYPYAQARDSHALRYIKQVDGVMYDGFPVSFRRKGFKEVKEFLVQQTGRGYSEQLGYLNQLTDERFLDTTLGYCVELDNSFDLYLVDYETRGEGGRAIKVYATPNSKEFYLIDIREDEFYDYLTKVANDIEPKIDVNGKLGGKFVLYRDHASLKPISIYDDRTNPE